MPFKIMRQTTTTHEEGTQPYLPRTYHDRDFPGSVMQQLFMKSDKQSYKPLLGRETRGANESCRDIVQGLILRPEPVQGPQIDSYPGWNTLI